MTIKYSFVKVTWQQISKHINISIIGATVTNCRSQCLVVSGEKERKASFEVPDRRLWGMWHCFNW